MDPLRCAGPHYRTSTCFMARGARRERAPAPAREAVKKYAALRMNIPVDPSPFHVMRTAGPVRTRGYSYERVGLHRAR